MYYTDHSLFTYFPSLKQIQDQILSEGSQAKINEWEREDEAPGKLVHKKKKKKNGERPEGLYTCWMRATNCALSFQETKFKR